MKKDKNKRIRLWKGIRFISFSMILSLFCGCNRQPQFVTESLQESFTPTESVSGGSEAIEGSEASKDEMTCYVHVCGEVFSPGVYELSAEARIYEAIQAAGGMKEGASETSVNLASQISDGMQIYIPTKEEAKQLESQVTEAATGLVNINTADCNKLQSLPGIGETRAQAIITYREENGSFQKIEDIMKVSGIKNSLFEKIKAYITV